ncbi:MAG: DNA repair protein RecN [Pseudomonadales bacterium]
MLRQLTVNNVGLVSDLDLQLTPGLTVLTGESGAGKSLLLAALGLVLGERASSEAVKTGAAKAEVVVEFDLSLNPESLAALNAAELVDPEQPNRCLVRRVVSREGRSRAFINDSPVTLTTLKAFAEQLVDIYGQQESYRLSEREVQRALLDDFGCRSKDRREAQQAYRAWHQAQSEAARLRAQLDQSEDRKALLTYQLEELAALSLQPGEFAEVEAQFRRLAQIQNLRDGALAALQALDDNPAGHAARLVRQLKDDDPHLAGAREYLGSATELMADAAADLRHYLEALDSDAESVARLEARLGAIHDAARKHKVAPEGLEAHIESISTELAGMSTDHSAWEQATSSAEQARSAFESVAKKLTRARKKAAPQFANAVSEHMQILGISGGALGIELSQQEGEHGFEAVEFLITTNPQQPAKALKKIASGGEQSRISLAIQIVAAEKTALPCLVLDEADVGVGGTTADVIGRLLRRLAAHTQILCVTHAPQVAALGQQHLRVFKHAQTGTHIEELSDKARLEELARMLAGAKVTAKTRTYAATLLEEAQA